MSNDIARKLISQEEGCKLKAYLDSLGKLHIGIGHYLGQEQSPEELAILDATEFDEDFTITQEQANALFDLDYDEAVEDIVLVLPDFDEIDEVRQAVLISQIFQLGFGGLRKFKNYLQAVRDRDWEAAATHSLDSLAARQTPQRWERQAEMLRNGSNPFFPPEQEEEEPVVVDASEVVMKSILDKVAKNEKVLQQIYDYLMSNGNGKKRR